MNAELNFEQTAKMPYRYLPSTFRLYTPALARRIACKTPRTRLFTTASTSRPYTFHLGASWAGKPEDPALEAKIPFPPDTLIGAWRDRTLMHPKSVKSVDAGEDFFFVQQVRFLELQFVAFFAIYPLTHCEGTTYLRVTFLSDFRCGTDQ